MIDENHPDQVRWAAKAEQVLSKRADEITSDDAKEVTSMEVEHHLPFWTTWC